MLTIDEKEKEEMLEDAELPPTIHELLKQKGGRAELNKALRDAIQTGKGEAAIDGRKIVIESLSELKTFSPQPA
jgi:hypothetical protein